MSVESKSDQGTAGKKLPSRPVWLQALRGLALACASLILLAVLLSYLLPREYRVQRSISIDAPPAVIHAYVSTLTTWPEWTTWNSENYPELQYRFEGPESGIGAISNWTDPVNGGGQITITDSDPRTGMEYVAKFEGFAQPMRGRFAYEPQDGATRVVWTATGDVGGNPINRYFGLWFDAMIGRDYEAGLEQLKRLAEDRAASPAEVTEAGEHVD